MGFFQPASAQIRFRLTCADPAAALSQMRKIGIKVLDCAYIDELSLHMTVSRKDYGKIEQQAAEKGWAVKILHRSGRFWAVKGLSRRPVLILGLAILLALSLFLPGRILFVQVEGNCVVPTNLILESAASHGLCLGASGREVRSERIKNAMLEDIPDLQWLGVNVNGCVAVISVRERQHPDDPVEQPGVSNLVAKLDGVIQSITVTNGTASVKPGDAVIKGQVLISGYNDLGMIQQATRAEGAVFAITARKLTAISPKKSLNRSECTGRTVKYGLLIRNKRINFYKSSGILDASCARIYSVWYMTLPGGFQLPVGIVKEVWRSYDASLGEMVSADLSAVSQHYLLEQLTDGQILVSHTNMMEDDSLRKLIGSYICREMIAQIQIEEN